MGSLPPISVFTFFAELPYALPVPHNFHLMTMERRTAIWDDWPTDALRAILGRNPPVFFDEQVMGTRMVVRHSSVPTTVSLMAASEVFADWVEPVLSEDAVRARRDDLEHWRTSGFQTVRSVVGLTRFVLRSEHPIGVEMTVGWLRALFRTALADLNTLLEALGMTTGHWTVGTIAPRELPALLPVLVESVPQSAPGQREGFSFPFELHDAYPALPGAFAPEREPVARAAALSNAGNHGLQPFMLAFRFLHAAFAERLAGDPGRAVIDLNTAVEVLVSALLTEGGRAIGWAPERAERANGERVGLRNRVEDHLGRILNETIDVEDASTPWGRWWADGYMKRNAAVHRGVRLAEGDAEAAFSAATDLVAHVKQRLGHDVRLNEIDDLLEYSIGRTPPWGTGLLGITFPWEWETS